MQLFITKNYKKENSKILTEDERIVHQCFHVLRYKVWQLIQIQHNKTRYTLSITNISKKEIQTTIQQEENNPISLSSKKTMMIALPNRRDKAELIVQKLTEIGIDNIIFWKAERSTIRDFPDKKAQRLQTIALEASEQAFRRTEPQITYIDNLFDNPILSSGQIILFHQDGTSIKEFHASSTQDIISIIGPEGWFSTNELSHITQTTHNKFTLGSTILRMETAAIIGSRLIKNS